MNKFTFLFISLLLIPILGISQKEAKKQIGLQFVEQNAEAWGLTKGDIENMIITDIVHHKHNGVTTIFFNQAFNGVPVEGATMNLNVNKDDKVGFHRTRFVENLKSKIKTGSAKITAEQAINATSNDLYIALSRKSQVKKQINEKHFIFEGLNLSNHDIPVAQRYVELENGDYQLVWNTLVYPPKSANSWNVFVNAENGEIVSKKNMTIFCNHQGMNYDRAHDCSTHAEETVKAKKVAETTVGAVHENGSYTVYQLPAESPIHATQSTAVDPGLEIASPYGWHDVNGELGAEFTTTNGNNVHAFVDTNRDGVPDRDEPEGGEDLFFDYPHQVTLAGEFNYDAAVLNLYYSVNSFHDVLYLFGFTEENGNFQRNNYGNGGISGDPIIAAEAAGDPAAANAPIWNNASYQPSTDGTSSVISMGVWQSGGSIFRIDGPTEIAGPYAVGQTATDNTWGHNWGQDMIDVSAPVALARDADPQTPTQCCGEVVNEDEIAGKVAIVDRGTCEFGTKCLNAQEAGAVAVIICNVFGVNGGDGEETINMAAGEDGLAVTIPGIFAPKSMCDRIKAVIGTNEEVIVTFSTELDQGPSTFNSSFDNGVVFHEYGHGFNNRVLGGPNSLGGLGNDEQMGEGWSDYFSLILTIEEGDAGTDARGIGSYLLGQAPTGRGIRRYPYSTDMSINPLTYDNIKGGAAEPHYVGEVWTAAIWDMTWAMIDLYGLDNDWTNPDSGNARAMRLITDGVAFVGASPGYEDSRDAILQADLVNYNGEHQCLLWEIFARRGMGFFMDQADTDNADDGREDFEPLPTCIKELKIRKTASEIIEAGQDIVVILQIANHTDETIESVVVTDELQDGLTFDPTNSTVPGTVTGNMITFDIGDMASLDEMTISYNLISSEDNKTVATFYDDIEGSIAAWDIEFIEGTNIWNTTTLNSNSGTKSWTVESPDTESKQNLIYKDLEISGTNPTVRFYHKFNTELGSDAGYITVSTDQGATWLRIGNEDFVRGGYNSDIQYGTFAIPALEGFSGFRTDYEASYIDMSDYNGQTVWLRWVFGSDDNTTSTNTEFIPGWYMDDLQLIDLFTYSGVACISGTDANNICTEAKTTFVDAPLSTAVEDLAEDGFSLRIQPNPVSDQAIISIGSLVEGDVVVQLQSAEGRVLSKARVSLHGEQTQINMDTKSLPSGFYFVTLQLGNKVLTEKLIKN